ncbi:MAG: aminoacetone oxidase family FAD-binding enzyme [Anaerolineaceae bacterium]|nr:aminoacetone oxidase family FAD-binding enzyme [Anaerolineaceae bacterium]
MKIGIIGGGASGIFAAIEARKKYSDITIFDKNDFLGRKLSSTGAGRCNLTNVNVSPDIYRSIKKFSFKDIIQRYDYGFLNNYLNQLGIHTYHTDDGWVYPLSNSARNISILLEDYLIRQNVKIYKNSSVSSFKKSNNRFQIKTDSGKVFEFDKLILASGGKAYPQLRASDEILQSLLNFGHALLPAFPALAPLKTSKHETKSLNGVRVDATLRILDHNSIIGSDFGNIIFTEWGLNGPGVMNLSHLVHQKNNLNIEIDFSSLLPQDFLKNVSNDKFLYLSTPLLSIFNKKIIDQLLLNLNVDVNSPFKMNDFRHLIKMMKFTEKILGTRDFEFAQISTGAIESSQINPESLESKLCPGLYFAGEVLDVFGPCGGFNLHWAFISGIIAGQLKS